MHEERKHATVMFSDIAGYTKLMGSDEEAAFNMLRRNLEIHSGLISQFNGILVKEIGDGILASFSLASNAVRCALAIQKVCRKENIPLKIGIHEGEMLFTEADILGDGVNIASRLQEISREGSITVSGPVYQDIKNKPGWLTTFIGDKTLKHVDEKVKVYEVTDLENAMNGGESKTQTSGKKGKLVPVIVISAILLAAFIFIMILNLRTDRLPADQELSIAVLPFKNLSSNPEDQYLADGMMETILTHLQKIKKLSVRSRTSVEQYRDTEWNIAEIGKALNATHIVEGSFQKIGNKAMLTVQLIEAATDKHIWADDFTRDWSDVFSVQQEVAEKVASELYLKITPAERDIIETIPTTQLTAYDFYLRARNNHMNYLMNGSFALGLGPSEIYSDNTEALDNAIRLYRKALDIDPGFAQAYSGLGLALWNKYRPIQIRLEHKADTILFLANKALSYNDQLDEAFFLKGIYQRHIVSNFTETVKNLKKATEINPNYAIAYIELGSTYIWELSDFVEGLKSLQKAYELDRSYMLAYTLNSMGNGYLFSGFEDKAKYYFGELFKLNSDSVEYYQNLAYTEWSMGRVQNAISWGRKAFKIDSTAPGAVVFLTERYSYIGNLDSAYIFLNRIFKLMNLNSFDLSPELANRIAGPNFHRVGYILLLKGDSIRANEYFNQQIKNCLTAIETNKPYATRGGAYYDLFAIYAFLNQKEKAFGYLEELRNKNYYPNWMISYFKYDPLLKDVRDDPRFREFLIQAEKKFRLEHDRVQAWLSENNQL